jgi:hypothetical protein
MRFSVCSLVLAAAALAFVAVPGARAQYVYYDPGYYAYYNPTYYNVAPTYYTAPGYPYGAYVPPYYYSANYYATPRGRVWSYGSYYPYTNQYQFYYGYRTYPRRYRW